jgi:hypothetical protein
MGLGSDVNLKAIGCKGLRLHGGSLRYPVFEGGERWCGQKNPHAWREFRCVLSFHLTGEPTCSACLLIPRALVFQARFSIASDAARKGS